MEITGEITRLERTPVKQVGEVLTRTMVRVTFELEAEHDYPLSVLVSTEEGRALCLEDQITITFSPGPFRK